MTLNEQLYMAKQMNKAMKLALENTPLDDSEMMEVADMYDAWAPGIQYKADKIVKYGKNIDGDTQLYLVLQAHTSQADWTPDVAVSLFKPIGMGDDGIPVWTQPYGSEDAYQTGDRVHFPTESDPVYESTMDNNVWSPEAYPQGWKKI